MDRCFIGGEAGRWDVFLHHNLAEGKRNLLVEHVGLLLAMVQKVKAAHRFYIDVKVILPGHLHMAWTLPMGDIVERVADYRIRRFTGVAD